MFLLDRLSRGNWSSSWEKRIRLNFSLNNVDLRHLRGRRCVERGKDKSQGWYYTGNYSFHFFTSRTATRQFLFALFLCTRCFQQLDHFRVITFNGVHERSCAAFVLYIQSRPGVEQ